VFIRKTCIGISWDKAGNVYGVRLACQRRGDKPEILDAVRIPESEGNSFSNRLSNAYQKLSPGASETVIAGGFIAGSVCFELNMPRLSEQETKQALQYELPRYLPYPAEELIWGYRDIGNEDSPLRHLRVYATIERNWSQLLSEFDAAGIKIDTIASPFMLFDDERHHSTQMFLPCLEDLFSFRKSKAKNELREMFRLDEKSEENSYGDQGCDFEGLDLLTEACPENKDEIKKFIPCLMLAEYGCGSRLKKDKTGFQELPVSLIPQRFRFQKIAAIFLLGGLLLSMGFYGGRTWWDKARNLSLISREKRKINKRIKELDRFILAKSEFDILEQEIEEADLGNAELLHNMHSLSTKLPDNMWVSNLSARGRVIDLTIKSNSNEKEVLNGLDNAHRFSMSGLRKRQNSDGSFNIYLQLTLKETNIVVNRDLNQKRRLK
jgi:hypothetical protein